MNRSFRVLLLTGATLVASGCGSSDERPEQNPAQGPGGERAAAPVEYFDDGYQGTWEDDAGVAYAVQEDGDTVSGSLAGEANGLSKVDFQLTRQRDGFKGTAQVHGSDGYTAEVRWELLPAGAGNLKGRQQTAWLDAETGDVLTFDSNPLWEPISVSVSREAAPTAVAMADPPENPPVEDGPGSEDDPGMEDDDPFADDPGMEDDDPFADDPGMEDDDPFADDPGMEDDDPFEDPEPIEDDPGMEDDDPFADDPSPTAVDDPEDEDIEMQVDEEARAAAEAAAAKAQRQRQLAEASREQRKDPEGVARALMKSIQDGDGRLYTSCWIINDDGRFLAGAREAEVVEVARSQMQQVWGDLVSTHPGIRKGNFVRFEGNIQRGKKTNEVRDGLLVYRLESGEEKSLNLRLLVEVEDGSWKVQDLEP